MSRINVQFGYGKRISIILTTFSFLFLPLMPVHSIRATTQSAEAVKVSASVGAGYYTKLSNFAFFADEISNAAITLEAHFPPNSSNVIASFAGVYEIPMRDDGMSGDQLSGDHIWTLVLRFGDYVPRFYYHDGAIDIITGSTSGQDSTGTRIGNYFEVAIVNREKEVQPHALAPDVYVTDYAANIVLPPQQFDSTTPQDYMMAITQRFYQYYPDSFDFIAIFSGERPVYNQISGSYTQAAASYDVSNDVQGINKRDFNTSASYSSKGRLSQIINMGQRIAGDPLMHEIGHRWGIALNLPALDLTRNHSDGVHLGTSTVNGKMRYGLFLNRNGDGTFTVGNPPGSCFGCNENIPFDDLELYLMGLLPALAVSPHNFVIDPAFRVDFGMVIPANKTETVTIECIQQVYGQRDPDERTSQKEFRTALLLATTRPASAAEMSLIDEVSRYFASSSTGYPNTFSVATRGLGRLSTTLNTERIPEIVRATVSGKKLMVFGGNFDNNAKILLNGERQKTANNDQIPGTVLIAKKAGKNILSGQSVTIRVQNMDSKLSPEFIYTRP
jgi:hypothetical protein